MYALTCSYLPFCLTVNKGETQTTKVITAEGTSTKMLKSVDLFICPRVLAV